MLICEGRQVVDVLVNNDVEVVWLVVRRDVGCGEGFGHLDADAVLYSGRSMLALYAMYLSRNLVDRKVKQFAKEYVGEREQEKESKMKIKLTSFRLVPECAFTCAKTLPSANPGFRVPTLRQVRQMPAW